jgi:hypothetical protein
MAFSRTNSIGSDGGRDTDAETLTKYAAVISPDRHYASCRPWIALIVNKPLVVINYCRFLLGDIIKGKLKSLYQKLSLLPRLLDMLTRAAQKSS